MQPFMNNSLLECGSTLQAASGSMECLNRLGDAAQQDPPHAIGSLVNSCTESAAAFQKSERVLLLREAMAQQALSCPRRDVAT